MTAVIIIATLTIGLIGMSLRLNSKRHKLRFDLPLVPNQLLTRFPLVFIEGRKSIFYFGSYWNVIPKLFEEHGFPVHICKQTIQNPHKLIEELEGLLTNWTSVHIVVDAQAYLHLQNALQDHPKLQNMICVLQESSNYNESIRPECKTYIIQGLSHTPLKWRVMAFLHRLSTKDQLPVNILAPVSSHCLKQSLGNYLDFANFLAVQDYK